MTLSDGQRRRMLAEALVDLRAAARHMAGPEHGGTGNLARLYNAQRGLKGSAFDDAGLTLGSGGDPTGHSGTVGADQPAADLATVDRLLHNIGLDAAQLARALGGYGPPRAANDADRLALARTNARPDPHCDHCATITEPHANIPFNCPPWEGRGPTTVGARLTQALLLCRWCYGFTADHDRLPTPDELHAHRDGRRVMVADNTPRRAS